MREKGKNGIRYMYIYEWENKKIRKEEKRKIIQEW